jgi:hypothetical protein
LRNRKQWLLRLVELDYREVEPMPFKSKAQRKWMYANNPKLAKKFEKETPKNAKLPDRLAPPSVSEKRRLARLNAKKRKSQRPLGKLTVNKFRNQSIGRGKINKK